jgi:alanine-synthesizing transaminase
MNGEFLNEERDSLFNESSLLGVLQKIKLARVESGQPVYDFSMFNPDIPPARAIVDRLVQASLKGFNHRYGVSRGLKKLREGFALKYEKTFGVSLSSSDEVCVTLGCKDATLHLFRVLSGINKNILVLDPCYPPYLSAADYNGLNVHKLKWNGSEEDCLSAVENFLLNQKVSAFVLNFPMNPTGDVVSISFWEKLVAIAKRFSIFLVNDFAYGELVHFGDCPSLLSATGAKDVAVEIYTMSKAYNIPGWRCAAIMGNSALIGRVATIKSKIDYGMFLPVQVAAAAALTEGEELVRATRETYARRLKVLSQGLKNLGWYSVMPSAGGSLWVKPPKSLMAEGGAAALAEQILTKTGVALLPGEIFGESNSGYLRLAVVLPEDKIREALSELERVYDSR